MGPMIVVYDFGAAQPGDIALGLADWVPCVFAAPRNEHTEAMAPLMSAFGRLVWVDTVESAAEELRALAPGGIVTFSEKALRLTSELAERLGLPHHNRRTVRALTDKWSQRTALREAGVDSVRHHRVDCADDWDAALATTGLPAVLKPAAGGASRNTYLIEDAEAGRRTAARLLDAGCPGYDPEGTLVLEEFLRGRGDCGPFGDYVSVEQLVQGGRVDDIAVTGKFPLAEPFRETGDFQPSPFGPAEDAAYFALARRAVQALGITSGLTHTELKLTPEGPRVIEVNGRLGGGAGELAVRALGVNLIELAGRVALGLEATVPPLPRHKVTFLLDQVAPRDACRLVAVDGVEEVCVLPGVTQYRAHVRPGSELPGGVHTQLLSTVIGECADAFALAELTREVNKRLSFRFAHPGEESDRNVTAAELGGL